MTKKIRVADYIYMIDSDPIDTFARDTTNNWWTVNYDRI